MASPNLPFTVAEARALGLPVYLQCASCNQPSRPIPLEVLNNALDLATAAASGRFKCRFCKGKVSYLVPMIYTLMVNRERLRMACQPCGKDQVLSAAHACTLFGMATPLRDIEARLKCRSDCALQVQGLMAGLRASPSGGAVLTLPGDSKAS